MEGPPGRGTVLDVTRLVPAAGGIVRRREGGRALTVLVHRPRYDDWTFPKGKLLDGESFREAAAREVLEETGLSPRLVEELPPSRYLDQHGNPKLVRYWMMDAEDGVELRPTQEVDEARWVTLDEARAMLTYDRDREILDAVLAGNGTSYLLRHAKAVDRTGWADDDELRPLSKPGRRQARALVGLFGDRPLDRVLSSPAVRCVETVRPLGRARSLPVEQRDELMEGASLAPFLDLLDAIAAEHAVLSMHGDLIPAAVEHLENQGVVLGADRGWKKGAVWALEREAGVVVAGHYVPPDERAALHPS
jgi:8-oxo-dGTP diphosphatase